mgnify:CR=1 FL=1
MHLKTLPRPTEKLFKELEPAFEVSFKRLRNGLTLAHIHDTKNVRAWVRVQFARGSGSETPETSGVTHLLEHMLFRGCARYKEPSDLEAAFEAIGGVANAFVDAERTCFHSHCHPKFLLEVLKIFHAMIEAPLFKGLETEKRVILQEILEDKNEQGEEIDPENLLYGLMFPGSSLALPISGSQANIDRFTKEDLTARLQELLIPEDTLVAASGDIPLETLEPFLNEGFSMPAAKAQPSLAVDDTPIAEGAKLLIRHNPQSQFEVCMGFLAPGPRCRDALKLPIVQRLLTGMGKSILTRRLREEKGLVYSLDTSFSLHKNIGVFLIEFATSKESLLEAIGTVLSELAQFKSQGVSLELSDFAKLSCLYDLYFEQDSPENVLEHVSRAVLLGMPWEPKAFYRVLLETTRMDVQSIAKRLFSKKNFHLVMVGPSVAGSEDLKKAILKKMNQAFQDE